MAEAANIILVDRIEPLIQTIRGHNVLIDIDLATLYGVPTSKKGVRPHLPERPEGCCAQMGPDPFFAAPQRAGSAQSRTVSGGFHVPADRGRSDRDAVAKCD